MIAEISLENFKRFSDLNLKIRNLTVLTGTNSSGKTSILHSILLARQMARAPYKKYVDLNGIDTLQLGSAEEVIHRAANDNLFSIEISDTKGQKWKWSLGVISALSNSLNAAILQEPSDT